MFVRAPSATRVTTASCLCFSRITNTQTLFSRKEATTAFESRGGDASPLRLRES